MAFKTFADGVALPASDLNTYLMSQALVKATAATRPASPTEGSAVYETDTDKLMIYTTATTGWQPPWNLPWGYMATAVQTSNQTGISTMADMTGLYYNTTLVANRRYRVTLDALFAQQTSTGTVAMQILAGGAVVGGGSLTLAAAAFGTISAIAVVTGSGATMIKGQASTTAGTVNTSVSATLPARLLIEDIGPSAAPA